MKSFVKMATTVFLIQEARYCPLYYPGNCCSKSRSGSHPYRIKWEMWAIQAV